MHYLRTSGITDAGLRRSNNEDAFIIIPDKQVAAVADGMGGAAAGEVASSIFVETVREAYNADIASEESAYHLVQQVFSIANERMIDHVACNPGDAGMGCTAELLIIVGRRYIVGHVGDSRIYIYRNRELRQLTKDHSLVQMQLDKGIITDIEARNHPKKNIVLRAVGLEEDFSLDILRGDISAGDLFLLCSDGLTDMIDDYEIASVLSSTDSIEQKAEKLISSAKYAGGKDNITVVLCQVELT